MRWTGIKPFRVTPFAKAVVSLLIAGVGVFYLLLHFGNFGAATLTVNVMNNGRLIHAVNLGEARWSGAAYQVYPVDDRNRIVAEANSGHSVALSHGTYVVKVLFSDGETVHEQWLEPIELKEEYSWNVPLDVPASAFGQQKLSNSWRP